jgi:hypothetical protein
MRANIVVQQCNKAAEVMPVRDGLRPNATVSLLSQA